MSRWHRRSRVPDPLVRSLPCCVCASMPCVPMRVHACSRACNGMQGWSGGGVLFVCLWCLYVCLRAGGRGMCDPEMSLRVRTLPFVITQDTAMGLWTTGRVVLMRACLCVVCVVCCRGRALALVVTTEQRRSTWLARPYGCHCCGPCLTKLLCSTGWWLCPSQGQGAARGLSFTTHRLAGGNRLSLISHLRGTGKQVYVTATSALVTGMYPGGQTCPTGFGLPPDIPAAVGGLHAIAFATRWMGSPCCCPTSRTYPEPELLSDDAINVDSEPAPPTPPAVPAAFYLDGPPGQEWDEHVGLLDGEWELEAPMGSGAVVATATV